MFIAAMFMNKEKAMYKEKAMDKEKAKDLNKETYIQTIETAITESTGKASDRMPSDLRTDMWTDGIMGLLAGDMLGNPVQFMSRASVEKRGLVKGMEAGGVFDMPAGSWTDDGSMTLCILDSLIEKKELDYDDIMEKFILWDRDGAYTPFGKAYDQGITCMDAIDQYARSRKWSSCGRTGEHANGNGGLMRIMPVCLYAAIKEADGTFSEKEAVQAVHNATLLTHNHLRACTGSGIYYFMCKEILRARGDLTGNISTAEGTGPAHKIESITELLQRGIAAAFTFYKQNRMDDELSHYCRLKDLTAFAAVSSDKIRSSGYVVDTLESVVWNLITTRSLEEALLQAVNLGDDADTVGAIAGGLAGLYYGYDSVPAAWKDSMQQRSRLEEMCRKAAETVF